ncbi:hypothetical protein B0H19DRAFT_1335804 [Mycena capillaripes]|nr:hypothetical protein B0H19DRAFT_1335804 [Mycena capillaripes]
MEATTNLGEAQHGPGWNNAHTGITMSVIESFKKYEELDPRRAEEIEVRKLTVVTRTSRNETELSEIRGDLAVARDDANASSHTCSYLRHPPNIVTPDEPSAEASQRVCVTPALPTPSSSELCPASPTAIADGASDPPDTRHVSTRTRTQAEASALVPCLPTNVGRSLRIHW